MHCHQQALGSSSDLLLATKHDLNSPKKLNAHRFTCNFTLMMSFRTLVILAQIRQKRPKNHRFLKNAGGF